MHPPIDDPSAPRQPIHRDPSRASDLAVGHLRVLRGWDYAGFGVLTALAWAALAWGLAAWISQDDWRAHPMLLGSLTLPLACHVAIQQFRWFLLLKMRRPTPKPPRAGWRVGVATTFVPGAESLEMLGVTVQALVTMAYPH